MKTLDETRIAVVGLGYVGLPLAVEFGGAMPGGVLGYDINENRVRELQKGFDRTLEVDEAKLAGAEFLELTSHAEDLAKADVYIVTTPTPVDNSNRPDLEPLRTATAAIAEHLRPGNIVIYESTVYPGATEEDCVPILEKISGLAFNRDFFAGYSPERINPGDTKHRLPDILKVTSGSTPEVAHFISQLYARIIRAGIHQASSIRVAEAAKVIENTQRDVNIALVNELAMLFSKLGIDTSEVLEAAGTKWNFLPFTPGLVGGHCIGVDPYYLTHKAEQVGYHPQVILAGRRINDSMAPFVVAKLIKKMTQLGLPVAGSRILIMGLTFKENTPDIRNSKVVDIIAELEDYGVTVDIYDPWVDPEVAQRQVQHELISRPQDGAYDAVLLTVAHSEFVAMDPSAIRAFGKPGASVLFDVKGVLKRGTADLRL